METFNLIHFMFKVEIWILSETHFDHKQMKVSSKIKIKKMLLHVIQTSNMLKYFAKPENPRTNSSNLEKWINECLMWKIHENAFSPTRINLINSPFNNVHLNGFSEIKLNSKISQFHLQIFCDAFPKTSFTENWLKLILMLL